LAELEADLANVQKTMADTEKERDAMRVSQQQIIEKEIARVSAQRVVLCKCCASACVKSGCFVRQGGCYYSALAHSPARSSPNWLTHSLTRSLAHSLAR
jgi:hypothetical protein